MLAEISAPRGFDTRLATVGYIVRGLLDDSSPNRHTSQGTANGMAGPVEWCSPDNHTCSFVSRPFVKAISGNQAPAEFQRVTECGLRGGCLRPCVDRACSTGGIPSPVRNQPPLHQGNLTNRFLRMLADHRDWLRGSDVVSRIPVVVPRGAAEVFFDDLLSLGQPIPSAH